MWTKSKVIFCAIMVLTMVIVGHAYWQYKANETTKQNETSETQNDRAETVSTVIETTQKTPITVETNAITTDIKDNKVETETDKEVDTELKEEHTTAQTEDTTEDIPKDTTEETKVKNEPAFYLSNDERRIVECIVMGEAGYEPYDGQILVAQCLFNACIKDSLQPSEVKTKYQYRGWIDNPTDSVKKAVSAVFDEGYKLTEELILYFYSPKYSKGKWHETQRFVIEVGGHRFFAEWDKK